RAGPIADVGGARVEVVARGAGRIRPASRGTAVAVGVVAVLAVLQGVDHAVPTLGEEEEPRGTGRGREGAGELLAVARAAQREFRAESGDLPSDGERARAGIHGTGGGERVLVRIDGKVAAQLQRISRLHGGYGERGEVEANVVAAQIDRRRGRWRPES